MKKKVIYSVNLGGYDAPLPVTRKSGYDYIMFTDDPKNVPKGWAVRTVKLEADIHRQSRDIKIRPHAYLEGYDLYIYLDANYQIIGDLTGYVNRFFKGGMLLHTHPRRTCIFQEANKIKELRIDTPEVVDAQMREYAMKGMPREYGLFQNGFLVRDNSLNDFCDKWMEEIKAWSYRDQLSLPYLVYTLKPNITVAQPLFLKRVLALRPHAKSRTVPIRPGEAHTPRVWHFVPGRGDKNLGRAYNEHCALVPEDDWICIRDGDTMFLHPFWPRQIEDIIIKHGRTFPLISCVTNRLGLSWQLPYGFSENTDIRHHMEIAIKHYDTHYDTVTPSPSETAGLFMLFPKSTWHRVKFKEGLFNGGQMVDWKFASDVRKQIGGIGIAKGIYLFHLYRLFHLKKTDTSHLI